MSLLMSTDPSQLHILAPGEPKPGAYVRSSELGMVWSGAVSWGTRHGDATIHWLLGKMHGIWNARRPDGQTVHYCEVVAPYEDSSWRYLNADERSFTHGTISVSEQGVIFTAREGVDTLPVHRPDDLESVLARDLAFLSLLRSNDQFAHATYAYLTNRIFRRDDASEGRWQMSWRMLAGMIARMRGLGETYIDFYVTNGSFLDEHTLAFEEVLERLGWHALLPEEYADDHAKAMAVLQRAEDRPAGTIAADERPKVIPLVPRSASNKTDPVTRMHRMAAQGRVSQDDFTAFFDLYDLANERAGAARPTTANA